MDNINIPVVYYHSIGPKNKNWVQNHLTLEIPYFEDQLKMISRNFQTITLKEFWEARNGLRKIPKNALVITLDDGYLDNWVWAFPYLKKYNLKATLFASSEFVDKKTKIRPIADPDKPVEKQIDKLENWGFLSWEEMREMEKSGLFDIQSHTMTHTKYFISDNLTGFIRPGADILYPVGNEFPEEKPYYIANKSFEQLLPYGYPLFESASAIIAKRVWINKDFIDEVIHELKDFDWKANNDFLQPFEKTEPIYLSYKEQDKLIVKRESDIEYRKRIAKEIIESKAVLEKQLNKKIEFLCWPHGDNNLFAHETAINADYLATTLGKYTGSFSFKDRIDARIGTSPLKNDVSLTTKRVLFNIRVYRKQFPFYQFKQAYYFFKSFQNKTH